MAWNLNWFLTPEMDAPTDRSLPGYAHDQTSAPVALHMPGVAATGCDVTIFSVCGLGLFLAFGPGDVAAGRCDCGCRVRWSWGWS